MPDLAPLHSFSLPYQANHYQSFHCCEALLLAARQQGIFEQRHLILGSGTNTLFSCDYDGMVIRLTSDAVAVSEDAHYYHLIVDAGHEWHRLVAWTLSQGIHGLENLALIPGTVGAAPVQNIGAYGVEFADVCEFVEYLDKSSLKTQRLCRHELDFGYRHSVFKEALRDRCVITRVGLRLKKAWQPVLAYGGLDSLGEHCQPGELFDQVIHIRQSKLPDPVSLPNAGSFFKNPLISREQADKLAAQHPQLPLFVVSHQQRKIPAAWLIEQCGLKGHVIGGIGIFNRHALIVTNRDNGTGSELLSLIARVRSMVEQRFGIRLELEVKVMGRYQELQESDYQ